MDWEEGPGEVKVDNIPPPNLVEGLQASNLLSCFLTYMLEIILCSHHSIPMSLSVNAKMLSGVLIFSCHAFHVGLYSGVISLCEDAVPTLETTKLIRSGDRQGTCLQPTLVQGFRVLRIVHGWSCSDQPERGSQERLCLHSSGRSGRSQAECGWSGRWGGKRELRPLALETLGAQSRPSASWLRAA